MQFVPALSNPIAKVFADTFRYEKLGIFRPSVKAFRQANFLLPERLAMSFAGVLLVRRSVSDVAIDHDKSRPVMRVEKNLISPRQHFEVIRITDSGDIPSVA